MTIGWKSRWFAPKSNYGEFLVEDALVRKFIDQRFNRQPPYAAISSVEIERTREEVKVILKTARPGLVIGPKGAEVDKLKDALEDLTDRRVNIVIVEIRAPDLDAQLVADGIAEQLKRRTSFRRTMKQHCEATMQAGAKGVKIIVSGRLGGSEMSRSETQLLGSIPLHTLEADVDYGFTPSFTTYGTIGVKVWIHRGMFAEQTEEEEDQVRSQAMTRARRRREGGPPTDARPRRSPREGQADQKAPHSKSAPRSKSSRRSPRRKPKDKPAVQPAPDKPATSQEPKQVSGEAQETTAPPAPVQETPPESGEPKVQGNSEGETPRTEGEG